MISSAYAQAASGSATGGDSLLGLMPIVLMFVLLYFMMIRPQMKRQKEHKAMIDALKAGEEVVAAGGILGRITVQRPAVHTLLPKGTIKSVS
jgi:preprotein translocase subunit YajC